MTITVHAPTSWPEPRDAGRRADGSVAAPRTTMLAEAGGARRSARTGWSRRAAAALVAVVALGTILSPGGAGTARADDRPASTGPSATESATSPSGARCRGHQFPIRLPDGGRYHIYGELCLRGRLTARTPVQILLHGGSYDHAYWDWPYQPRTYSYVWHATRAGYATLNLDRLGYGRSSRPDPSTLDFAVGGQAVHQVVRQLRRGVLGPRLRTIILNGHSMGGLVAERAAAHGGVDAVLISGIPPRAPDLPDEETPEEPGDPMYPFYPAERDPKFAARRLAPGYLTTRPGTRAEAFHYPGMYDPGILVSEERLKDTLTIAELRSVRPDPSDPRRAQHATSGGHVPTAYVLGRHDVIACRQTADCTTDPRAAGADHIAADSGHSINTSLGAVAFYRWTFDWLARTGVGPRRG